MIKRRKRKRLTKSFFAEIAKRKTRWIGLYFVSRKENKYHKMVLDYLLELGLTNVLYRTMMPLQVTRTMIAKAHTHVMIYFDTPVLQAVSLLPLAECPCAF